MGKIWNIGAAQFIFTDKRGKVAILNKTLKAKDSKLEYDTERYSLYSDQRIKPEFSGISEQNLTITVEGPLDFEELRKLSPDIERGTTGFKVIDAISENPIEGKLSILRKGGTPGTSDEWILGEVVVAYVNLEAEFHNKGLVFSTVEFLAFPDSDGDIMKTGDYTLTHRTHKQIKDQGLTHRQLREYTHWEIKHLKNL